MRVESTRKRRAEVCAVHAKRMHRVVETLQRRDEREESSRRGPFECRRYAGGVVVAKKHATVTVVHSRARRTRRRRSECRHCDCRVWSDGVRLGSWLKPGAAVIDVGINAKDDATKKLGYDSQHRPVISSCKKVAGKMTPVPGGVGPMTIAILLQNTLEGAARSYGVEQLGLKN